MKKNFLKVAALLIAAMLMVVSCAQEVAPVNNGLVEAKLVTTFGRELTVNGGTKTDSLTLKYTMNPNWNGKNKIGVEEISGIVSAETPVGVGGSLGWVTPGLWTVNVYAFDATGTKVFEGTNDAYFSNNTTKSVVTVYMKPVQTNKNSLSFSVKMQDLAANGIGYSLKYSVVGTPYLNEAGQTIVNTYEGDLERSGVDKNVGTYTLTTDDKALSAIPSDYYRVTVSVYEGTNLIGGITKGIFLANGDNGSVTGNIEPSDYVNAKFDIKLIDVATTIAAGSVTYYSDNAYTTTTSNNNAKSASVVITLTDNTAIDKYDAGISSNDATVVNTWYVDGVAVTDNTLISVDNDGKATLTLKDTIPGYKNVSCQTIYYKDVDGVRYSWANTASVQVQFEGTKFAK